MKKIISLLLSLAFSVVMSTSVFANEITEQQPVASITVVDENGNDVKYTLYDDSTTSIPIFAVKEDASSRTLTEVATLHISVSSGLATFLFTPANVAISLITIGFTGTFTTYFNGIRYGYNDYLLPIGGGSVSAADTGTGSLSGTYKVIGYEPASVLQGFSW